MENDDIKSGTGGIDCFKDGISISACDYAELFETIDGYPIDVGYFVTLDGEKIRKATSSDSYILGVTSATPGILGNSNDFQWKDKYLKDEWGRIQYHEIRTRKTINKKGKIMTLESIEKQPVLNPKWDSSLKYNPRLNRPEWVAVGLLGKIRVRDDGTCRTGGYCKSNSDSIATDSNEGYKVVKRTGPYQVLIIFR